MAICYTSETRIVLYSAWYHTSNGFWDDITCSEVNIKPPPIEDRIVGEPKLENYPNPFNPTTKIVYFIQEANFVSLKIYDILGREIKTLVKEMQQPGAYSIDFNAENISSGIYFYRINSGNFSKTNKMILSR